MKLGNVQNRNYPVIHIAVREEFSMTDAAYRSEDYTVNVLFSEPKYDNSRFLYCCICTTKQNLKEQFRDKYPEKLPKYCICGEELRRNWDNLDLWWNAHRFIQQPKLHWETVYQEKRKPQKDKYSYLLQY